MFHVASVCIGFAIISLIYILNEKKWLGKVFFVLIILFASWLLGGMLLSGMGVKPY